MSYLDHIHFCNDYDPACFLPFLVDDARVGSIQYGFAECLEEWPDVFQVTPTQVGLAPDLASFGERTRQVKEVVRELVHRGVIARWHGEQYPVSAGSRDDPCMLLDRAAVPYFGVRAYGQHLNGYVGEGADLKMWLARRSPHKWNDPGKLDNLVAGGLPHGLSTAENLAKECGEEAGMEAEMAARAQATDFVSYCKQTPNGLKPDIIYCYDLQLPEDFQPRCTDGEVAEFILLPIEEVAAIVRETTEVKANCNLVIIDFLIRRGFIDSGDKDYPALVAGLRPIRD